MLESFFERKSLMLRKTLIFLATALALGGAAFSLPASARDRGGDNGPHGADIFVPPGGGGGHMGGFNDRGFAGRRGFSAPNFRNDRRFNSRRHRSNFEFGFDTGLYGDECYQTYRYHTRTGWHRRYVYICQ
jgi:hypothetical protein